MTSPELLALEREMAREVEAFGRGMATWYTKGRDQSDLQTLLLNRLDDEFTITSARGELNTAAALRVTFGASGGKIPSLDIRTDGIRVVAASGGVAVVVFDEFQSRESTSANAKNTTGRVATAVLVKNSDSNEWRWRHLHYTWLPEQRVKDFVAQLERDAAEDRLRDEQVHAEHSATRDLLTSSREVLREAAPLVALAQSAQAEQELALAKPAVPLPTKATPPAAAPAVVAQAEPVDVPLPSKEAPRAPKPAAPQLPAKQDAPIPDVAAAPAPEPVVAAKVAPPTPAKDVPQLPAKETPQLPAKEVPPTPVKEVPATPVKEVPPTPVKDVPAKEIPQLPVKEVPATPAKEVPQLPAKDVPATPAKEVPQLPAKDVPATPAKDVPQLPPKDVTEPPAKPVPQLPTKQAVAVEAAAPVNETAAAAKARPELPKKEAVTEKAVEVAAEQPTTSARKATDIDAMLPASFLTADELATLPAWKRKDLENERRLAARAEIEQSMKDDSVDDLFPKAKAVPTPPPKNVDSDEKKAAAEKAADEKKVADEKAASEKKAAEEKVAAEKKAASEKKAADEKVAAEKAAEKKAADEKAAAEKTAAEKKVADEKKAADEKAAAEKKAADEKKAAADKAAAEKAAADKKAADEKATAEKKAADEKAAAEKKAAEEKAAAEKKAASDKAAAEKKAAEEKKAAAEKQAAEKKAAAKPELPKKDVDGNADTSSTRGRVVPTGDVAPITSGGEQNERQRELEERREATDFKPQWKLKEEEDERRREQKRQQRAEEEALRAQGIEPPAPEVKKDKREYLDDYYNTEKAIAARNLVRFTHFRHVRCDQVRRALCFFGPRLNNTAAQNSTIDASPRFYAICLTGAGSESGALGVLPLDRPGKQAHDLPYIETGAPILDFSFDPFDECRIAVSTESGAVLVYTFPSAGLSGVLKEPSVTLRGHQMKATRVWWHPSVADVLLSASPDCRLLVWNARSGALLRTFANLHAEAVVSLAFDYAGARVATVGKDGSVRVSDLRSGATVASLASAHKSKLDVGVAWLGRHDWLFTVGFGATIAREYALWQLVDGALVERARSDFATGSGSVQPMYDEETTLIMCAGKGDSSVAFFEFTPEEAPYAHLVALHRTAEPQRGVAWLPKRVCSVRDVEIRRFLKLTTDGILPTGVFVPRNRPEFFQDDLFKPTRAPQAAASCERWLGGADATPTLVSMQPAGMTPLSEAPKQERKAPKYQLKAEDEGDDDVTEQLFLRMNRLAGAKSKEDQAMEQREGVSESEWEADESFDMKNYNPGFN
jgi:hypothetical protein